MATISKLLILLGSIGTSCASYYVVYNNLFSSRSSVEDQPFNDGFDLKNVDADKYLKIDSALSVRDQKMVISKNTNLVKNEIGDLMKIYDSEKKNKKHIDDKLHRKLEYKLVVFNKLLSKIKEI